MTETSIETEIVEPAVEPDEQSPPEPETFDREYVQ